MAYVPVPKDLNAVKTKVLFNLTKRQLICFGAAGAVGIPFYIFTKDVIGTQASALIMVAVMLLWNWLITPLYLGYPRQAVEAMLIPMFLGLK